MVISKRLLQILVLVFLSWLILWNGSWEFRSGMDSMTYGSLAKHILTTGDWARLHYSAQAYADFFMHPPLVMWMTAGLFKLFGATDITSKILPNFFGWMCVLGVFLWGLRFRNSWWGFVAGFVLLSSVRFTKYSVGLMLDPFLAAFMLWSVFLAQLATATDRPVPSPKRIIFMFASGLCLAAAFMSKGVPTAAALMVALILVFAGLIRRERPTLHLGLLAALLIGTVVPVAAWVKWGGGGEYLARYWAESVAGRVQGESLEARLRPLANLCKVYWPWLPFWTWGVLRLSARTRGQSFNQWLSTPVTAPLLASLAILGGFSFSGHFLEQYLVPFYPFAALVVAEMIALPVERFSNGIVRFLFWLAVGYAMILAALPLHVQGGGYKDPMRLILTRAAGECDRTRVHRLQFSTGVADIWYGTAMGLWYTPWDVYSGPVTAGPSESGSDLLLASAEEKPNSDWMPTGIAEKGLKIFVKKDLSACPMTR